MQIVLKFSYKIRDPVLLWDSKSTINIVDTNRPNPPHGQSIIKKQFPKTDYER
jgi:hypothetical protein